MKTVNKTRLKGDLPLFISSQLQELPPLMTMQRMFLSRNLQMQLQRTMRIDIVWDTYLPESLKESREKRGKGVRRKVSGQTKLPGKWMDFLCDSKNKTEFFYVLN